MFVRVRREEPDIDIDLPPISEDGPHPLISDSLFSLIIFIYVAVTFCYIFYAFCWREAPRKELTEEEKKNIPMITEQLSKVEEKETTAEV